MPGSTIEVSLSQSPPSGRGLKCVYGIRKTVDIFIAVKNPGNTGGCPNGDIGKIEIEFFAVKLAARQMGNRHRHHEGSRPPQQNQQGRIGVMQTGNAGSIVQLGTHTDTGTKKPMADFNRRLGRYNMTICEQTGAHLGDYLRAAEEEPLLEEGGYYY